MLTKRELLLSYEFCVIRRILIHISGAKRKTIATTNLFPILNLTLSHENPILMLPSSVNQKVIIQLKPEQILKIALQREK